MNLLYIKCLIYFYEVNCIFNLIDENVFIFFLVFFNDSINKGIGVLIVFLMLNLLCFVVLFLLYEKFMC